MCKAVFRFYEELNDFLPKQRKKRGFEADFKGKRSIKDMIEAIGVPHTEIDLILVDGKPVDFNYILLDGDRVSVYPVFEYLNIENITRLRKKPLRRNMFIVDANQGDVAKYMRAMGFDVYFDPSLCMSEIVEISKREKRIILTGSRKLLKFKEVTHGVFVRPGTTEERVNSIVDFLDIRDVARPFSRCFRCNNILNAIAKKEVASRIPLKTLGFCNEYFHCRPCDKIYWKGTHFIRMKKMIDKILCPAARSNNPSW